jgi:hypothetical protein
MIDAEISAVLRQDFQKLAVTASDIDQIERPIGQLVPDEFHQRREAVQVLGRLQVLASVGIVPFAILLQRTEDGSLMFKILHLRPYQVCSTTGPTPREWAAVARPRGPGSQCQPGQGRQVGFPSDVLFLPFLSVVFVGPLVEPDDQDVAMARRVPDRLDIGHVMEVFPVVQDDTLSGRENSTKNRLAIAVFAEPRFSALDILPINADQHDEEGTVLMRAFRHDGPNDVLVRDDPNLMDVDEPGFVVVADHAQPGEDDRVDRKIATHGLVITGLPTQDLVALLGLDEWPQLQPRNAPVFDPKLREPTITAFVGMVVVKY